jgi:hypothetical protein
VARPAAFALSVAPEPPALKHISTRLYLFALVTGVLVPLLAFAAFLRFEIEALQTAYHVALAHTRTTC